MRQFLYTILKAIKFYFRLYNNNFIIKIYFNLAFHYSITPNLIFMDKNNTENLPLHLICHPIDQKLKFKSLMGYNFRGPQSEFKNGVKVLLEQIAENAMSLHSRTSVSKHYQLKSCSENNFVLYKKK